MNKIIFVCTGNTCRSPMAEKLGEKIVEEKGMQILFLSRGISVFIPEPANNNAIKAMKPYGVNLKQHISKNFDEIDAQESALILTMTMRHKAHLLKQFPNLEGNIFGIKEYVGETGDIVDPYGMELEEYHACATQLIGIITKIIDRLKEDSK